MQYIYFLPKEVWEDTCPCLKINNYNYFLYSNSISRVNGVVILIKIIKIIFVESSKLEIRVTFKRNFNCIVQKILTFPLIFLSPGYINCKQHNSFGNFRLKSVKVKCAWSKSLGGKDNHLFQMLRIIKYEISNRRFYSFAGFICFVSFNDFTSSVVVDKKSF